MKKIYLIFVLILSFSLMACSPTSITTGRYVMEGTEVEEWSWIEISEGNQYEFNRALNVSYRPSGKYIVQGNQLILKVGDNSSYTFIIEGNSLIYDSTTTSGHFLKKGTVYTLKTK